ncbi:hypothetical protein NM688_g35 [Phlebia brevispora]|uniref:Uncharacterized protein n=1 Tax=Phlebia brevispora TaxID=194682 RepID=A0ACC1TF79_9APHY|nr:hypothetical protein NM688_g35 [Phlebia brevispora]
MDYLSARRALRAAPQGRPREDVDHGLSQRLHTMGYAADAVKLQERAPMLRDEHRNLDCTTATLSGRRQETSPG